MKKINIEMEAIFGSPSNFLNINWRKINLLSYGKYEKERERDNERSLFKKQKVCF